MTTSVNIEGLPAEFGKLNETIANRFRTALNLAGLTVAKEASFKVTLGGKLVSTGGKHRFPFVAERRIVDMAGERIDGAIAILNEKGTEIWTHKFEIGMPPSLRSLQFTDDPVKEVRYGMWFALGEHTLGVQWPDKIVQTPEGPIGLPGKSRIHP